jgi:hypothetical protein
MKWIIFIPLLMLSFGILHQLEAQETINSSTNRALIWRGFDHSWTYNHRINRLGDYVFMGDSSNARTCHTSASGLGADSTFFTTYYSYVESSDVAFQEGMINIKLFGKEKQLLTKTVDVNIPATDATRNQEEYVSLLNGFDIKAMRAADKLELFRVSVEDAYYAAEVDEIRFRVKVSLLVNCQSIECSGFNQKTTYDLNVYYLIIAGQDKNLASNSKNISKHYPWSKRDEHLYQAEESTIRGEKSSKYKKATVGIKSLAVTLNKAHWTVVYRANVTPLNYQADKGKLNISSNLLFQEWVQGMKRMSAHPKHSRFSSKKKGWAILDMEVAMIQIKDAYIKHGKRSGSTFWKGRNASPDNPNACCISPISIKK